jgi:hypothetical protein
MVKVEEVFDGLPKVLAALKVLRDNDVLVGIPDGSKRGEGELPNAALLYIHAHGVRRGSMRREMQADLDQGKSYDAAYQLYIQSHGSPLWHSPPRPVLEPSIDANKDRISEQLGNAARAALDGDEQKTLVALKKAGMVAQNSARAWFVDSANNWPPNAQATIDAKGSDRPLIDTGEMRKAIIYVLRKRGGKA